MSLEDGYMKKFNKLKYAFEDATKAIIRNKTISIISIITISLILITIGLFILYLLFIDKNFEKVSALSKQVRIFSRGIELITFIMLPPISIFLIVCESKVSINSRKNEIDIKKFIGATNSFIRWPFIIEGLFIGIIGACISSFSIYFLYSLIYNKLLQFQAGIILVEPIFMIKSMFIVFIICSILLNIIGNVIALRKILKEKTL